MRPLRKFLSRKGLKEDKPELRVSLTQRNQLLDEFRAISSLMEVQAMMGRTIEAILRVLPVERASVFLIDRAGGVMRSFNAVQLRQGASADPHAAAIVTIPLTKGLAGAVVQSASSEIVPDAQRDPRFNRSVDAKTGFHTRNVLTVPVLLQHSGAPEDLRTSSGANRGSSKEKTAVAVLQALNHKGEFSEHDVSVLELLATLLSGVLARSSLVEAAVREKQRANSLLRCADSLFSSESPTVKALHVMRAVRHGLDCDRASLILGNAADRRRDLCSCSCLCS